MPGAYAHITLVNALREPQRLEAAGYPPQVIKAVLAWFKFCVLGAVSPDYPYLALTGSAKRWADLMHYDRTGAVVDAGVRRVRAMSDAVAEKCSAWLLGYASHVVTDVTVHPVVELKVGPYEQNKTAHRICEMHQDAHIFQRLNLGGLRLAEYLDASIGRCSAPTDRHRLDPDIVALWRGMLADVHPAEAAANPPEPDRWHRGFIRGIDKVAEEGDRLWPVARHVAIDVLGLVYPGNDDVDPQYIANLRTPTGPMNYDAIFNQATRNVLNRWEPIAHAIADHGATEYLAALGNWNLDTGRDQASNELVFWSVA